MRSNWRRWIPGAKHGPARSVAVFGRPGHPDPTLLGSCAQLRPWARTEHGLELENSPSDLSLLDRAFDEAIGGLPAVSWAGPRGWHPWAATPACIWAP